MRILGIDPGSAATGFGLIELEAGELRHHTHGTLRPPRTAALATRLLHLQRGIEEVIRQQAPDVAVIEQVFVSASPRSALVLGHARGVVLAAVAGGGLPLNEYDPRQIKQAVTAHGAAGKDQVRRMVQRLLGLERLPGSDAADALAAAICHAHAHRLGALGAGARRGRPRSRRASVRVRLAP